MVVPPALAVKVAVSVELTAATVAVNDALVAPAATVTEAGTVTAALLLVRLTANPPVPAAAVRVSVHASLPAPVIDPFAHDRLLSTPGAASPVPLRAIVAVPPPAALLVRLMVPVAAPAAAGSNCTLKVAVWPGLRVSGKLTPDIEKPAPVMVAALTITEAVPDEVSVTACVAGVFTTTSPKARLDVLSVSPAVAAFSVRA